MDKQELIPELKKAHSAFITYIGTLTNEEFSSNRGDKWTAGQQLKHIELSVKPLVKAFTVPKSLLKMTFGKAKKPSVTYEVLVANYQEVLKKGGKATKEYIPPLVNIAEKARLLESVRKVLARLLKKIEAAEEKDLDEILVPHPLLGKLTLREMLYFTLYHVKHHHKSTEQHIGEWMDGRND